MRLLPAGLRLGVLAWGASIGGAAAIAAPIAGVVAGAVALQEIFARITGVGEGIVGATTGWYNATEAVRKSTEKIAQMQENQKARREFLKDEAERTEKGAEGRSRVIDARLERNDPAPPRRGTQSGARQAAPRTTEDVRKAIGERQTDGRATADVHHRRKGSPEGALESVKNRMTFDLTSMHGIKDTIGSMIGRQSLAWGWRLVQPRANDSRTTTMAGNGG